MKLHVRLALLLIAAFLQIALVSAARCDTWKCDNLYTNVKRGDNCTPIEGGLSIGGNGQRLFSPSHKRGAELANSRVHGTIFSTNDARKLNSPVGATSPGSLDKLVKAPSQAIHGVVESTIKDIEGLFNDKK